MHYTIQRTNYSTIERTVRHKITLTVTTLYKIWLRSEYKQCLMVTYLATALRYCTQVLCSFKFLICCPSIRIITPTFNLHLKYYELQLKFHVVENLLSH